MKWRIWNACLVHHTIQNKKVSLSNILHEWPHANNYFSVFKTHLKSYQIHENLFTAHPFFYFECGEEPCLMHIYKTERQVWDWVSLASSLAFLFINVAAECAVDSRRRSSLITNICFFVKQTHRMFSKPIFHTLNHTHQEILLIVALAWLLYL